MRVPTNAYKHWLYRQDLLDLDEAGLAVVEDFYEIVAQTNGSLDAVAQGYRTEQFEVVMLEGAHNCSKAQYLIELGQMSWDLLQEKADTIDE